MGINCLPNSRWDGYGVRHRLVADFVGRFNVHEDESVPDPGRTMPPRRGLAPRRPPWRPALRYTSADALVPDPFTRRESSRVTSARLFASGGEPATTSFRLRRAAFGIGENPQWLLGHPVGGRAGTVGLAEAAGEALRAMFGVPPPLGAIPRKAAFSGSVAHGFLPLRFPAQRSRPPAVSRDQLCNGPG
jgi:hypothetical protein